MFSSWTIWWHTDVNSSGWKMMIIGCNSTNNYHDENSDCKIVLLDDGNKGNISL
uniref:Uncharacterized protein n=1 Tax=Rhizophora mucronata TaxID=61149 RepID=A0A2P2PN45_RHIMU